MKRGRTEQRVSIVNQLTAVKPPPVSESALSDSLAALLLLFVARSLQCYWRLLHHVLVRCFSVGGLSSTSSVLIQEPAALHEREAVLLIGAGVQPPGSHHTHGQLWIKP